MLLVLSLCLQLSIQDQVVPRIPQYWQDSTPLQDRPPEKQVKTHAEIVMPS